MDPSKFFVTIEDKQPIQVVLKGGMPHEHINKNILNATTASFTQGIYRRIIDLERGKIWNNILSYILKVPPEEPEEGDTYIITDNLEGEWETHENSLAVWMFNTWEYSPIPENSILYVSNEDKFVYWDGTQIVNSFNYIVTDQIGNKQVTNAKLSTDVQNSLTLANSALQNSNNISLLTNDSGYLTSVDLEDYVLNVNSFNGIEVEKSGNTLDIYNIGKPTHDLEDFIDILSNSVNNSQTHRNPTTQEKENFIEGISKLMNGNNYGTLLSDLGFTVYEGIDSISGRKFIYVENEFGTNRSWGSFLIDPVNEIDLQIQINHTTNDIYTEYIGLDVWRKVPGCVAIFSGIHRNVNVQNESYVADTAKNVESIFHEFCKYLTDINIPVLNIHGMANLSIPGVDVVNSQSAGIATEFHFNLSKQLELQGYEVRNRWDGWTQLTGTTNIQGIYAAEKNINFIHIEFDNTLRTQQSEIISNIMSSAMLSNLARFTKTNKVTLDTEQSIIGEKSFDNDVNYGKNQTGFRTFTRYYRDGVEIASFNNNAGELNIRAPGGFRVGLGTGSDSNVFRIGDDGVTSFNRVVSGVTPTENLHLATKQYVDTENTALRNLTPELSSGTTTPTTTPTKVGDIYVDTYNEDFYISKGDEVQDFQNLDNRETSILRILGLNDVDISSWYSGINKTFDLIGDCDFTWEVSENMDASIPASALLKDNYVELIGSTNLTIQHNDKFNSPSNMACVLKHTETVANGWKNIIDKRGDAGSGTTGWRFSLETGTSGRTIIHREFEGTNQINWVDTGIPNPEYRMIEKQTGFTFNDVDGDGRVKIYINGLRKTNVDRTGQLLYNNVGNILLGGTPSKFYQFMFFSRGLEDEQMEFLTTRNREFYSPIAKNLIGQWIASDVVMDETGQFVIPNSFMYIQENPQMISYNFNGENYISLTKTPFYNQEVSFVFAIKPFENDCPVFSIRKQLLKIGVDNKLLFWEDIEEIGNFFEAGEVTLNEWNFVIIEVGLNKSVKVRIETTEETGVLAELLNLTEDKKEIGFYDSDYYVGLFDDFMVIPKILTESQKQKLYKWHISKRSLRG